jgi:membrane associated rhomboid family serine protease
MVLVVINLLVFFIWQASRLSPQLLDFMRFNFVISTAHLLDGRVWTLVTAAVSQMDLVHLLFNMMVLYSFGPVIERLLGSRRFVWFYLGAATFSSLCHCMTTVLLQRGAVPALGASGVMTGLLLIFALLFPKQTILIFGVIPVPALIGVLGFVGLDIWGLVAQSQGHGLPIGHGAHLGGTLFGAMIYFGYVRPKRRQLVASSYGLTVEELAEAERLRRKVAEQGHDSLTYEEQSFLHQIVSRTSRLG